jgi:hypothetical protein
MKWQISICTAIYICWTAGFVNRRSSVQIRQLAPDLKPENQRVGHEKADHSFFMPSAPNGLKRPQNAPKGSGLSHV